MTSQSAVRPPAQPERRDLEARDARDALATLLRVAPGQLRRISAAEAQAMVEAITAERTRNDDPV